MCGRLGNLTLLPEESNVQLRSQLCVKPISWEPWPRVFSQKHITTVAMVTAGGCCIIFVKHSVGFLGTVSLRVNVRYVVNVDLLP